MGKTIQSQPHYQPSSKLPVGSAGFETKPRRIILAAVLVPLGYLWFHLINNLRLDWANYPQYSYGLFVPLLVLGLLIRRWQKSGGWICVTAAKIPGLAVWICLGLAIPYLPVRLVEEATPEWRPIQWALAFQVIGLTLYAIYLAGGKGCLRQAAFPIGFFLVAIPWPTLFETPIIQGLSRLNAAAVVNVLDIISVPAIQHGNIIEVATGTVGINDACSGIRSLQSSLMISLFLGEYYSFDWKRRLLLIPASFGLALLLNICRTSLLTWIAAQKGIAAIDQYHDEAGWTILIICTTLLWVMGWLLSRWNCPTVAPERVATTNSRPSAGASSGALGARMICFSSLLMIWLVAVEFSVAFWYNVRESHIKPGPDWSVNFPVKDPSFKTLPMTAADHELLRFDQGQKGQWQGTDGSIWQVFYFNWQPGRIAGYLAKRHTPDICITAAGFKMTSGPELKMLNVHGIELPMRHYVFASSDGPLQVYQCHWEAGLDPASYTANESTRFNLIRGVWAGRGNLGQKVLEIIVTGYDNPNAAQQALTRELDQLIKVDETQETQASVLH